MIKKIEELATKSWKINFFFRAYVHPYCELQRILSEHEFFLRAYIYISVQRNFNQIFFLMVKI